LYGAGVWGEGPGLDSCGVGIGFEGPDVGSFEAGVAVEGPPSIGLIAWVVDWARARARPDSPTFSRQKCWHIVHRLCFST